MKPTLRPQSTFPDAAAWVSYRNDFYVRHLRGTAVAAAHRVHRTLRGLVSLADLEAEAEMLAIEGMRRVGDNVHSVKGWIYRRVVFDLLSFSRRLLRHRARQRPLMDCHHATPAGPDHFDDLLVCLDPDEKEVVRKRYVEGMSYVEMSQGGGDRRRARFLHERAIDRLRNSRSLRRCF